MEEDRKIKCDNCGVEMKESLMCAVEYDFGTFVLDQKICRYCFSILEMQK